MTLPHSFRGLSTLIISIASLAAHAMANDLNFRAHFGSSPAPFKIDVSPDFIKETTLKVSLTRLIVDVDVPEWSEGPSRHNVSTLRNYWLNGYDWFKIQDQLNKK